MNDGTRDEARRSPLWKGVAALVCGALGAGVSFVISDPPNAPAMGVGFVIGAALGWSFGKAFLDLVLDLLPFP